MDTSETYIKMRLAAIPDLGRGVPFELGDGAGEFASPFLFTFVDKNGNFYCHDGEQACQLERQDQLQEILKNYKPYYDTWVVLVEHFYNFAYSIKAGSNIPTSMEQLWLAFYMKNKYNKVWSGTEWVTDPAAP